jgi:type IV secretory pathway TraG/TraD family ATPase VirD4
VILKKKRTPYKGKPIAETWLNMIMSRVITNEKKIAKVWLILDSFPHIYGLIGLSLICCVTEVPL